MVERDPQRNIWKDTLCENDERTLTRARITKVSSSSGIRAGGGEEEKEEEEKKEKDSDDERMKEKGPVWLPFAMLRFVISRTRCTRYLLLS